MILAIDPGNIESAYVVLGENLMPIEFGKVPNDELADKLPDLLSHVDDFAVEMVASYGMPVGAEVFETVFWIGRFWEIARSTNVVYMQRIYRKEEKMNLCNSMKAKDGNIRQALIDRFGVVGTKKKPGWFYGVSKDVWSAIAVGVTFYDKYYEPEPELFTPSKYTDSPY